MNHRNFSKIVYVSIITSFIYYCELAFWCLQINDAFILQVPSNQIKQSIDHLLLEYQETKDISLAGDNVIKWSDPQSEENIKTFYLDIVSLGNNIDRIVTDSRSFGKKNSWKKTYRKSQFLSSDYYSVDVDVLIAKDLVSQLEVYLNYLNRTKINVHTSYMGRNKDSFQQLVKNLYGIRCKPPFPFPFDTNYTFAE